MCVTKLLLTSECRSGDVPVRILVSANTERLLYRVLREPMAPGGATRSVDRKCAGRNATSVNGIEPRQTTNFCGGRAIMRKRRQHRSITGSQCGVWRMRPRIARDPVIESAPPGSKTAACTQGQQRNVRDLPRVGPRSLPRFRVEGQGVMTKSASTILETEVRCVRISEEVG